MWIDQANQSYFANFPPNLQSTNFLTVTIVVSSRLAFERLTHKKSPETGLTEPENQQQYCSTEY